MARHTRIFILVPLVWEFADHAHFFLVLAGIPLVVSEVAFGAKLDVVDDDENLAIKLPHVEWIVSLD